MDMVYGVPLVIGAKKGFPNFNEFGLLQDVNVARNLIFHRVGTTFNTKSNLYDGHFECVLRGSVEFLRYALSEKSGSCGNGGTSLRR